MTKTLIALFIGLVSSTSFAARVDQVCRDGIGSTAVISTFADNYIVQVDGPAKQEFIKRGLFITSPYGYRYVQFQSPLDIGPWGTRIIESNRLMTQIASWEDSTLVVKIYNSSQTLAWRFQNCER
jgi:hypothetical protein